VAFGEAEALLPERRLVIDHFNFVV
jgi:hypothetical protein